VITVTVTPSPPDQLVPYKFEVEPGANYRASYSVPADSRVTLEVFNGKVTLAIDPPPPELPTPAPPPAQ